MAAPASVNVKNLQGKWVMVRASTSSHSRFTNESRRTRASLMHLIPSSLFKASAG